MLRNILASVLVSASLCPALKNQCCLMGTIANMPDPILKIFSCSLGTLPFCYSKSWVAFQGPTQAHVTSKNCNVVNLYAPPIEILQAS